jgi:hypothetical protein
MPILSFNCAHAVFTFGSLKSILLMNWRRRMLTTVILNFKNAHKSGWHLHYFLNFAFVYTLTSIFFFTILIRGHGALTFFGHRTCQYTRLCPRYAERAQSADTAHLPSLVTVPANTRAFVHATFNRTMVRCTKKSLNHILSGGHVAALLCPPYV